MISDSTLCTREDVKAALDIAETARSNRRVDRAIESATAAVEGDLRRSFRPWNGTRHFDWPSERYRTPWRLWLDGDELISVASITAGGVTIPATDYLLGPPNSGPPYTYIDIDQSSSSSWSAGDTWQQAIAITGMFGSTHVEQPVGELAGPLGASDTATANVTWNTSQIGVGDLLHIGDEHMVITERTLVDSTQNLGVALTASNADNGVAVTDGTAFDEDEIVLAGTERMRVLDIAGNTLTVKRAFDGTVLAAHSIGADIYALTGVTLARAVRGTTLAAHLVAAPITRHVVPPLVRDFALALALNQLLQESAGYARVAGSGDNQREISGRGIAAIREDALVAHGRQNLVRSV